MSIAIHFCSASLQNEIILTPITEWDDQTLQVMFIVRSSAPLTDAQIQLSADGDIVWSSPLRPEPAVGIQHPYHAEDDQELVYITTRLVQKNDLVVTLSNYSVGVVEDGNLVSEVPFTISYFETIEEEVVDEIDTNAINELLELTNKNTVESEAVNYTTLPTSDTVEIESNEEMATPDEYTPPSTEITDNATVLQEEREDEDLLVSNMVDDINQSIQVYHFDSEISNEVLEVAPNEEEELEEEIEYKNTISFETNEVAELLASAATQPAFSINLKMKQDPVYHDYQIVIEQIDNTFITVINDAYMRPFYLTENANFMKQWDEDFDSYFLWVKDQLSQMFNVSSEQLSIWKTLFITNEATNSVNEQVTIMNRTETIEKMKGYAAVLDVVTDNLTFYVHFEDNRYLTMQYTIDNTSIEQVQSIIETWKPATKYLAILPTGIISQPANIQQLGDQFQKASTYRNTSLAWEFVTRNCQQDILAN